MTIPAWLSTVLRVTIFALLALLAQTYLRPADVPLALKACVVGVGVLAAVWPEAGLLVFAGVVPFARVISYRIFDSPATARFTEALVLAFLAGWILRRVRPGRTERSLWPGSTSALLLAAMLVASVLVEMGVLRYWKDYWGPYFGTLAVYFGRDYLTLAVDPRPWAGGVNGLMAPQTAALFLEGIALMWVVLLSCARDAVLRRRLVHVSVAAAIGTAALSLEMAARASFASGMALLDFINDRRVSAHTSKVNVAASYYVLFLPVAGALAWGGLSRIRSAGTWARRLVPALAAAGALVLLGALWMTGSRSALMALIGVLVAAMVVMAATRLRDRQPDVGRRGGGRGLGPGVWVAAAGVVVIALLLYALYGRSVGGSQTWPILLSLKVRLSHWTAAMSMVAAHPLFGVGIGQFRLASAEYLDQTLRTYWGNAGFPAHNQFLQMTGELGLIGGALFAAMFLGILWRAWIAFRRTHDALLGAVVAGLVGFLITCLAGNPLAVEVVAYPFWVFLGVALAVGAIGQPSGVDSQRSDAGRGFSPGALWRPRLVIAFLVVLAVSIPVRIWLGTGEVNFALARYGLADDWSNAGDDRDYKLVRDGATFFVYTKAYWVDVPVRRDALAGADRLEVDVLLDGRVARTLTLDSDNWQTVGFLIPPDANRPYRRIDLAVRAPHGAPAVARLGRPGVKR